MIITDIDILRKKNEPSTLEEAKEIIKKLEEELKLSPTEGAGLAAPQIGINKKVAIIRLGGEEDLDLVNPVIIDRRNPYINRKEGCLSFPNVEIDTQRYNELFVKDDLHPDGFVAVGFVAAVVEHEVQHLESILMIDVAIGKNKVGRNDPCPCGAMKNNKRIKFKNCHGK